MDSDNATLDLDSDSLYICLTQLFGPPGRFHWSIYITDAQGLATQYQWAEDLARCDRSAPVEKYSCSIVQPVKQRSETLQWNLAFIKMSHFVRTMDSDSYDELFANIFTTSWASWKDNRQHGLSCRTWAIAALQKLREKGGMRRLSAEQIAGLEAKIIAIGCAVEQRVAIGDNTVEMAEL
ncbi:uncharacterized protein B0H18DRAFT_1003696 [Fomitopsis serialis]|uniref:uncharacterized protein n=1 Tax=Fomitopsis serialis TaxID=139415 RepID=UPI0020072118|nr:uncharacterized protein B0H18DRAFT_1003696 [Neoantrodia serialis]KAH9927251.1 hypothetical protein B0H18DRAFT_1003696 [Neoantrodia serialis]